MTAWREWAQSGLIVPINPGKKVHGRRSRDTAWNAFKFQGKTWGYPISVEAIGLVYKQGAGEDPPKSFDDVIKLDKELSAKGKHAILWDYNNTISLGRSWQPRRLCVRPRRPGQS